jgi:tetratricopeptide (TPR) repeat protein
MIKLCRIAVRSTATIGIFVLLYGMSATPVQAQTFSERLQKAKAFFDEGQKAYLEGNMEKALGEFKQAHRLVPSAELAYNIGHISEQLGDIENAVRFLELYISRSLSPGKDQKDIETRIARLRSKVASINEQLLKQLSNPKPLTDEARSFFAKGITMFKQGRYRTASALFAIVLNRFQLPEIYYNIALASERLGRTQDAVSYYRAYLRKRSDAPDKERVEQKIRTLLETAQKET